jgi:imidazolonepropionase-like amidohydrolase
MRVASLLRSAFIAIAWLVAAGTAFAESIAITGGKVYPVSGPPIENATVLVTDGRIVAVGTAVTVPAGATVIEAKGAWVTPGLFNGATTLGLKEVSAESSTDDDSAKGDHAVAAGVRVWEGLNPQSVLWAPARNEGVTTVASLPEGGLIAGQGAVVDTLQGTAAEMLRQAPAVMVANLSSRAADTAGRGELFLKLRELLEDARVYVAKKVAFEGGSLRDLAVNRLHLAALQPVLEGKLLLLVKASRSTDIEAAIGLSKEYKLRLGILGGEEAWMVAPALAQAKIPVFTTALDNIPASFSSLGSRQENAALLRKAGVPVAIIADAGETFNVRNIRQHAGNAVAYGLPWDEALRAVTLTPAEAFGVDTAIGSLQPGRDANVVVWDGDPFEFSTRAVHVFIRGKESQGPSRQDMLTERYVPKKP